MRLIYTFILLLKMAQQSAGGRDTRFLRDEIRQLEKQLEQKDRELEDMEKELEKEKKVNEQVRHIFFDGLNCSSYPKKYLFMLFIITGNYNFLCLYVVCEN